MIHPQSYVHSIIRFKNGLIKMVLYNTDMRIPISNTIYNKNNNFLNIKNVDIKTLAEKLINQLKSDKIVIPDMIRNFSTNISKLRDEVLKNNKIDINDWINSNYDDDILDNIEKGTFNIIH